MESLLFFLDGECFGINVLEFQSRSNGDQMMAGIIEPILVIDSSLFFFFFFKKEASSKIRNQLF